MHICFLPDICSQETTYVISRKIEKQFSMKKNSRIIINSERGIISIKGWDQDVIKVVLKLVAKNIDREMARRELGKMKYALSETRNTVFVSNRMLLSKADQQISSVIRVEYKIYVPNNIEIQIDNRYGKVDIQGINGSIYGELYYSDLSILETICEIGIFINIGDLLCRQSKLTGRINTRHSNANLSGISGKLHMNMEYGNLSQEYGNEKFCLGIRSNATNIFIEHSLCYPLELVIDGGYCPLKIAKSCYSPNQKFIETDYIPDIDHSRWFFRYLPPDKATKLTIYARFGTLNFL